ncbi:hypothetical protein [Rahnella woolbedingensis]|uniref:Uncharacterized protein n=1 Tax=Rahnella woolbedingensis TaxID=1510574 RepID=A0A419NC33_9GAMM|nr:hypothetical protein [Rahnella woolbedingensis]RJT45699.1 hypothetical protein D6C13_06125 [Rahnella woolbedingensis]
MKNPHVKFEELITIADHLAALINAEDSIIDIERQLKASIDNDSGWRNRANHALASWKGTRRSITARLALLRQREKEANQQSREKHGEFLIEEMKRYIPRVAFMACDHRAKLRMEALKSEAPN